MRPPATAEASRHGAYHGSIQRQTSPITALTYEREGALVSWPLADWLKTVRERPSAKSRGLARDDAILMLDRSGPSTAFVKVRCQLPPLYFTDYLCLVKAGGAWRVAQKVFAAVVRP